MAMDLKEQIAQLERQLQEERLRTGDAAMEAQQLKEQLSEQQPRYQAVYVAPTRKLERFRGRPATPAEPTIEEWAEDVRMQLATRKLEPAAQAAFVMDHLSGNARQEILGRGLGIRDDPGAIFEVLLRVFGDGDTLPTLQQKFFSYQQGEKEDLLGLSLKLVEMYDRICRIDPTYVPCREGTLKGRLAEAARDEGLRRELRRLTIESGHLSYFDMRDRAIGWLGGLGTTRKATIREVSAESEVLSLLKKQGEQLLKQQQHINQLLETNEKRVARRTDGGQARTSRACYRCGSDQHLIRECPQPKQPSQTKIPNRVATVSTLDATKEEEPPQDF